MRIDEQGWLISEEGEAPVKRLPTVRTTALACPRPLGIVWHWTAGRGGPGFAERLARMAQTYRRGVDRAASWHLLIAKDGTIYQSAPFTVGTWHVGRPGVISGRRFENVNRATIGCELENAGRLQKIGERFYCWPFHSNPGAPEHERRPDPRFAVEANRVVLTGEGLFDAFTLAQEHSASRLLLALAPRFGWTRADCSHGHIDFDSPRKEDPGPLWKRSVLPRILDRLFGTQEVDGSRTTSTT